LSQTWMESGKQKNLQISFLVGDKILGLVYGRKLNCLIDYTAYHYSGVVMWKESMILKDIEINMFLINIAKHNFPLQMPFGAKKIYIPSYIYICMWLLAMYWRSTASHASIYCILYAIFLWWFCISVCIKYGSFFGVWKLMKYANLNRCFWGCCFWPYSITYSWWNCLFCMCTSSGMALIWVCVWFTIMISGHKGLNLIISGAINIFWSSSIWHKPLSYLISRYKKLWTNDFVANLLMCVISSTLQ